MEKVVYLIKANNLYKIGVSRNLEQRLNHIRYTMKCPVELIHSFPGWVGSESTLHETYRNQRVHGEWFDLTSEDVKEIRAIQSNRDAVNLWYKYIKSKDGWVNLTP